jgi:hypothetical protein
MAILILGQIITIFLLFFYGTGILNEIATYVLILVLIVLGIISFFLEIFLKQYSLIPIDLYETGSNVYINIYTND